MQQRRFTKEFEEGAVRLMQTSGRTQREIAGDLGIGLSTLVRWIERSRDRRAAAESDVTAGLKRRRQARVSNVRFDPLAVTARNRRYCRNSGARPPLRRCQARAPRPPAEWWLEQMQEQSGLVVNRCCRFGRIRSVGRRRHVLGGDLLDRGLMPAAIRPHDVATYIEQLQNEVSAPSVKQQLAAVRMLFDWWSSARWCRPIRPRPCAARSMS